MFSDLAIQPITARQLKEFYASPSHALLLTGSAGSGKEAISYRLAASFLEVHPANLHRHPYFFTIHSVDGKAISIEAVRELEHFLSLKVPRTSTVNRIVHISTAELLGTEAQNALLKTLEEPPVGTLVILTAVRPESVLPTIQSRTTVIAVRRPEKAALVDYFSLQGKTSPQIEQAFSVGGGLPGLMSALLNDESHDLLPAVEKAREILSLSTYERLAIVEELGKQKNSTLNILYVLQQMAHVRLQTAGNASAEPWRKILEYSYKAEEQLAKNGQPKLVLTQLMLNLA